MTHVCMSLLGHSHPTSCCSAAEIMAVLFFHTMRYKALDPRNPHNDRFVLSKVGSQPPTLHLGLGGPCNGKKETCLPDVSPAFRHLSSLQAPPLAPPDPAPSGSVLTLLVKFN